MANRARKPWSKVSLHRHLYSLLDRPTTTLKFGAKRNGVAADCEFDDKFPPAYVRITVDANNNETVRFVIHELIHVTIAELVLGKFDSTLEEVVVLSLETYIWNFVSGSKTRLAKWEKLIAKKLAENPPATTPLSLEELADRSADDKK